MCCMVRRQAVIESLAIIAYFRNVFWFAMGLPKQDAGLFSESLLTNLMGNSLSPSGCQPLAQVPFLFAHWSEGCFIK